MRDWRKETVCLGTEAEANLGKLLLEHLSEGAGGLTLYRAFLEKTLSLNIAHSNLYQMEDDLLRRFYQEETLPPKFFSFPEDLSRLERVLDINIVVARVPQGSRQDFLRIHDRRVYSLLAKKCNKRPAKFFYLSLEERGELKVWALRVMTDLGPTQETRVEFFDSYMISHGKMAVAGECRLELVCDLLHMPLPPGHRHEEGACYSLLDLCGSENYIGVQIIFATHLSTAMTHRVSRRPQHHVFGKLGYLPASAEDKLTDFSRATVICVNAVGNWYLLHEPYAATVRSTPPRKGRKRESCLPAAAAAPRPPRSQRRR